MNNMDNIARTDKSDLIIATLHTLEIMLSSIFVPSFKGGVVRQEHKDKYLWLVAYAASVHEEDDKVTDTSEVEPTYQALRALEDTLSKRAAGTDVTPILGNLLRAIEYVGPVC